jgi:predicted oxidoreductase
MHTRQIGDRTVSAIGFGEMPLSIEGRPDRTRAISTIHASLDAGVTIIDTADAYSLSTEEHGHGERLVADPPIRSWWLPREGTAARGMGAGPCTATRPTSRRPAKRR